MPRMRSAASVALALLAPGCALDAAVRVVTTARERCEWRETVVLGGDGDRFRVPEDALEAALAIEGDIGRRIPVAAGARIVVRRRTGTAVSVDDTTVTDPGAAKVTVTWVRRTDEPVLASEVFPVDAAALPWAIDWEIRPAPRRVPDGECRLDDVRTTAELVGGDAGDLTLDVAITPGHVRGTVRRREAP